MDRLEVSQPDPNVLRFVVHVEPERGPATDHDVTLSDETLASLGAGYPSGTTFIEACFTFLVEREPNTSILRSFDVDVIGRYFPEFPDTIRRRS